MFRGGTLVFVQLREQRAHVPQMARAIAAQLVPVEAAEGRFRLVEQTIDLPLDTFAWHVALFQETNLSP